MAKRIHTFDLKSLLQLLAAMGWRPEEILLTSHYSNTSQDGLIHAIEFLKDPVRQVHIILNMGLLSAQSPLPTYFFKKIEEAVDTQRFVEFLGYFDHVMLSNYVRAIYPELDPAVFGDWDRTKRRYVYFLNLKANATLHWLFQSIFPELSVRVDKATLQRGVSAQPLRLGSAQLGGDAVFGKKTTIPVNGRRVTLTSEQEQSDSGQPWPRIIQQRLEEFVFPILREVGLDLEVTLVITSQRSWARLQQESYLGYDKVQGGDVPQRRITLFSGYIVN